jgi:hypothetical protein
MAPIEFAFPSDRWFAELVRRATEDRAAIERLGIADFRLGVEIVGEDGSPELFGIVLDGYDIQSLGHVDEAGFAPDVVLTGPIAAWQEMVDSIEANGVADIAHTLDSLSIAGVPFEVRADDAMGHDKVFRYMGTLQAIFDAAGAPTPVGAGR